MRLLLIEPGKSPREMEISGTLASMQSIVGGPIQAVYPFEAPVALVSNDDGKLLDLPLNRALREDFRVGLGIAEELSRQQTQPEPVK